MSTQNTTPCTQFEHSTGRRVSTEIKASFKTTELVAYVGSRDSYDDHIGADHRAR